MLALSPVWYSSGPSSRGALPLAGTRPFGICDQVSRQLGRPRPASVSAASSLTVMIEHFGPSICSISNEVNSSMRSTFGSSGFSRVLIEPSGSRTSRLRSTLSSSTRWPVLLTR
ncbi:hypothetical protein D3C78_1571380 [compost metagenome]